MSSLAESCSVYTGVVNHARFVPHVHKFKYIYGAYFLPLLGGEHQVNKVLEESNISARFERKNYFGDKNISLSEAVLQKASDISGMEIVGEVFFLGQLKHLGFYFSPVNFYFIKDFKSKKFKYMIAEVTNTPWNENHCYLVDVDKCAEHEKQFHVSPFNPMDMIYQWKLKISENEIYVKISCLRNNKLEFAADLAVEKNTLRKRNYHLMTFRILVGIYVQALKLFIKRTPFYTHPKDRSNYAKQ